jgi:formiminotetrahydrofolate cyclodeaminase
MSTEATTPTFVDLPLPALLARFADKEPVPGGGSAASIAGALAASLAAMVGALTEGKKGYEDASGRAGELRATAARYQAMLLRTAAQDADAFEGVMAAMALPKETDEQKAARRDAMQLALQNAATAPLEAAQACIDVGELALELLAIGNKNASSDAAVGALLAATGAESALLNVAINLGSIKDEAFTKNAGEGAARVWAQAASLRERAFAGAKAAGLDIPR